MKLLIVFTLLVVRTTTTSDEQFSTSSASEHPKQKNSQSDASTDIVRFSLSSTHSHVSVVQLTDIVEMASSRPASMVIFSSVLEEPSTNGSKSVPPKKDSLAGHSSNQAKLPGTHITIAHSSLSSIDSTGAKLAISNGRTSSLPQTTSLATVSSTTTDSELESEQEERDTDDNHSLEIAHLPRSTQQEQQQQRKLARRDSGQQKTDSNTSEQLSRRDKHFQKLFKSEIPTDDMPELIDSYVCAYQGDILLQGKMYITDRYLCFHSRIISYVTKHVYRWDQIENITKERVAFIFPTAIGIQLKPTAKKITYASFLQRDQAYDKLIAICSRVNNESGSLADDDDSRLMHSGTLKAANSRRTYSQKEKTSKHNNHYDTPEESEHDNVLKMCLAQDEGNSMNKRRIQSVSSKSSDDKRQMKKSLNADKKKTGTKNSTVNSTLTNSYNGRLSQNEEANRSSRHSKSQAHQADSTLSDDPVIYREPTRPSSRARRNSRSRDRNLSPTHRPLSNLSPSESPSNILLRNDLSPLDSQNYGFPRRHVRIILLSIISIIKLLIEYLSLLFNQFKAYPIKTSLILLIFVTILVIHSFYLIQLAYRIENRLQSLHDVWPLPATKISLPSSQEL